MIGSNSRRLIQLCTDMLKALCNDWRQGWLSRKPGVRGHDQCCYEQVTHGIGLMLDRVSAFEQILVQDA